MERERDPRTIGAWAVGLTTLVIYTLTTAPTVAFWDVGEFIATSVTLGVPHPPGAPTFVLLGRLFTLIETPFGVAAQVNWISALSSAFAALFLYLIILEVLRLWEEGHEWSGYSPIVQTVAAATGALAYAFSSSAWFNAVEAEVYGLSIMVTALSLWLAFRHLRRTGRSHSLALLLLIAYVLGIGAGNHLLALLTIPSILILLWYMDRKVLTRWDFWAAATVLFLVGYSLYAMLYIRSGLNPPIDMNNPENWQNFIQFLQRRQYETESMLTSIFERKAPWGWQIDFQFLRYYRDQFLALFYLIAFAGALINLYRDKRTFFAIGTLWLIMGFGLVVYLNMPDPQPRDRDYIFVGCYFATAIWIGTGTAGLAGYVRQGLAQMKEGLAGRGAARLAALVTGVVGIGLVLWQTVSYYHSHDRTGDYIPWDYAWNILQTADEDAILFTNGDNDTFPLWYLQVVEGIRRDVRVVNLSLLNTDWYIKELRDREPRVPIRLTDQQIRGVGLARAPGDTSLAVAGIPWRLRRGQVLRVLDQLAAHIVGANQWQKPIYFAITVPNENQAGFSANMQLEGFGFRLTPGAERVATDRAYEILTGTFQYRGLVDPSVHKDENTVNLITNYGVVFRETARALAQEGRREEALELLEFGEGRIPTDDDAHTVFMASMADAAGDTARSRRMLREVIDGSPEGGMAQTQAIVLLMYSYADTGEWEAAAGVVRRWLELAPGDTGVQRWIQDFQQGVMPAELEQLGTSLRPGG